jgi:hypothetical protein
LASESERSNGRVEPPFDPRVPVALGLTEHEDGTAVGAAVVRDNLLRVDEDVTAADQENLVLRRYPYLRAYHLLQVLHPDSSIKRNSLGMPK